MPKWLIDQPTRRPHPSTVCHSSGVLLHSNDNWRDTQEQQIIDTTIPPTNDFESAIVTTIPANNSAYTAVVRGKDNLTGVGLVEVYDLDRTVDSKLANISTRGLVGTENNVMIGGTIVPVTLRPTWRFAASVLASASAAQLTTLGLAPQNSLESGIYTSLTPGAYTAILAGLNSGTGVGLLEMYQVQ
jgi:hypothetical protein